MKSTINLEKKFNDFIKEEETSFDELALQFFHYQREYNKVYKEFLKILNKDFSNVNTIEQIPFMPVSFFKNSVIKTGDWTEETVFESSSTSGAIPSRHYVRSLNFYRANAEFCFNTQIGNMADYCFFALLPSYLERNTSSLVYMTDHFIKKSGCGKFYKTDYIKLNQDLKNYAGDKKIILLGVTYALMEFAKYFSIERDVIVMETGGMKGRGPELPRELVHEKLRKSFNIEKVFSEYGMTELMSQAYSKGDGVFTTPTTMKILISDIYDPFSILTRSRQGKVNIIDLANYDTCCFISTDDLGIKIDNDNFKILGRTDESDIRGCNLLYL
jgi:hypothetical protein